MMVRNLFLIATITTLVAARSAEGGPKLTIPGDHFDFGFVPQNCKVSHIFWLHSTGDDTVRIASVIPGCGCTEAPLKKTALAPGDSTPLEVTFSSGSYVGAVVKEPSIQLKNELPESHVQIKCRVVVRPDSTAPIVFKPYALNLTQFGETPRTEARFSITNVTAEDVSLSIESIPDDVLALELATTVKAGQTIQGIVRLKPEAMSRGFDKSITFRLSDEPRSRFTLPVTRKAPPTGPLAPTVSKVPGSAN
ncbi:MAG: DUF1573 domain-containing protein [Candidatus Zixiibacteriota bacterium]